MKKILFTIFSLFVLASCSHNEIDVPNPLQEEKETVNLTFSVNVPQIQSAASRAFGETATLRNLYVIVFDERGNYVQTAEATNLTVNNETDANGNKNTETNFTVTLAKTNSPRILHFIGNADVSSITYGSSELDLSRLKVSLPNDATSTDDSGAYWQRVEFPNGINEEQVQGRMDPVYLVRNFAKISVSISSDIDKPDNIEYNSFTVVNVENTGSVTPYYLNKSTNELGFAQYAKTNDNGQFLKEDQTNLAQRNDYNHLVNTQKYTGYVPGSSTTIQSKASITEKGDGGLSFEASSYYLYERTHNDDVPTFVIVKALVGTGTSAKATYYKIDLITNTVPAAYYHILRNFAYNITIEKISGEGYDSALEAANNPAGNNIFASTELQSLTNISDGTGRLFVNYTSRTLVSGMPVTLEYMYIPNIVNEDVTANSDVQFVKGQSSAAQEAILYYGNYSTTNVENEGYSSVTIYPNTPGESPIIQSLTLYAGGLQRTVTYTLQPYFRFNNVTTGSFNETNPKIGSKFEFKFNLPDGMDQSLFPMTFIVEANPQTIYPNTDDADNDNKQDYASMPATTLEQSFGYERTVTWEEYKDTENHTIVCGFKINTTNYATVISVSHDLFKTGITSLGDNALKGEFSNLTINGAASNAKVAYGEGQDAIVTFNMDLVDESTLVKITADGMASATSTTGFIERNADGTFTYTPTRKAGKQTITFKTGNATTNGSIRVESGETGDSKKYANSLTANYTREFIAWSGLAINGKSDGSAAIEYIGTSGNDAAITFYMPHIKDMNGNDITVTITASQFASSSTTGVTKENNGTFTYTPTKAGWQSVTLKTDGAVHGAGTVKLTANYGYNTALEVGFKNVLTLTSSNLRANKNTSSSNVTVYANDSYTGTSLATGLNFNGNTPYALNNGPKTIILSEGMTNLYFRYRSGYIYQTNHDASATIESIVSADGATLSFN